MTIKKKDKVPSETIMTLTKMHLKECASPHTGPLVTFISFFLAKHSTMDQKSYLVQRSKLFLTLKTRGDGINLLVMRSPAIFATSKTTKISYS